MTETATQIELEKPLPDHTQLPESDGTFVKNFQEHPQSIILTDSIGPVLERLHPDGQYAIGQDSGIYWRQTDPPEQGAVAPDWFYIPNVPPLLDGRYRRSYVLWQEYIRPLIVLELASGDGTEERDKTPISRSPEGKAVKPGKFWIYEQVMRIPYYGIYQIITGELEVYRLVNGYYEQMSPNARGHYEITPLGVELGLWQGSYQNQAQLWLRWWDTDGNLLLTGAERTEVERARADRAEQQAQSAEERARSAQEQAQSAEERAQAAEQRAEMVLQAQRNAISRLLGMGLTIEEVATTLSLTPEEVRQQQPQP
ncbi:Uma2 family endonuclease [[Phormidium] sp. ETS-05]|uniref:Uma2 family endonuclease n=1 Tax=[Phormidium] sp. ETS-05 TaxID=222819 RepID=UPI0018EF35C7|nr:Uma2 family endonuclease [[Phormidium] sp. ETS-05]